MGDIEQRIIDLLGYIAFPVVFDFNKNCYVETKNYWTIFEKNGKNNIENVGYVKYDETFNMFYIKINSPTVTLDESRPKERKTSDYNFALRGPWGNGNIRILMKESNVKYTCCPVEVNIKHKDEILSLRVCDYASIFRSDDGSNYGLDLSYTYNVGEYSVTENIEFRNMEYDNFHPNKEYRYVLSYNNDSDIFYHRVDAISDAKNPDDLNVIIDLSKCNDSFEEVINESRQTIKESVASFAKENVRCIELMNYFREKLHEMLPFNEDIFSELMNQDIIKEYGLQMFFEEKKEKNK